MITRKSQLTSRLSASASSLVIAAAVAAPMCLAGSSAFAQAAPAAPAGGIETVVVTAQFTEQNLQSTPVAISAITADQLEQRGFTNMSQLGAQVPSLTLNPAPAAFGNGLQAFIRGIGAFDTAYEHEPAVGIYVDDLFFGTIAGTELELMDLSRVEVLRGPQGVLGGKNDIGGAIKLFSQKPEGGNTGYLQVSYGTDSLLYIKGAADLTVIPDRLFLRVSGMSKEQDGYVDVIDYACKFGPGTGPTGAGSLPVLTNRTNCRLGTQGGTNVQGARAALRWVMNAHMEDTLAADIVRDNSEVAPDTLYAVYADGVAGQVYYNNGHGLQSVAADKFFGSAAAAASAFPGLVQFAWNPNNVTNYGIPWDQRFITDPYKQTYATYTSAQGNRYTDGSQFHSWSVSNIFDIDIFDNLHLKVISGYRQYDNAYSDDSDVSPLSFQLTTTYNRNWEFQQEERFTGTLFNGALEWSAGQFHYERTSRSTGPVIIDAIPLVFEQNDRYETTNNSEYLHLIYHVMDNLEVFGGMRYTSETKTYFFNHIGGVPGYPISGFFRDTVDPTCAFVINASCPADAPLNGRDSKTARTDWRGGVDYHFTDDLMAYFQYSTGYRPGGTNSRPFDPGQLTSYGPETIKSYELGAKTDWFDHRLRLNVALYYAKYENTIIPIATTSTFCTDPNDPNTCVTSPYVKNVNLGSTVNKGVEIEMTAAPVDGLLLTANYSYIHARAEAAPGAPPGFVDPLGTIPEGSPPAGFPKQQLNLSAQYTLHLGDNGGDLTPRVDYNWQDVTHQDALGSKYLSVPARGLLDARITWDAPVGGWEASIAGTNLTDKEYFYDMFNLAAFGFGTVTGHPARGREWTVTIRKNF